MVQFAFRRHDGSAYERMVSSLTGEFVHVDLVIDDRAYTAYLQETFSENPVQRDNPLYKFVEVPLPEAEDEVVRLWVRGHVERRTPYNNKDLYYCILKPPFVRDADHNSVQTLFCSQACVLALRAAVQENEELRTAMAAVNSRLCTPQAFYKIIEKFSNDI